MIFSSPHSITVTLRELSEMAIAAPDQFREACPITVTSANGATVFWIMAEQANAAWVKMMEHNAAAEYDPDLDEQA